MEARRRREKVLQPLGGLMALSSDVWLGRVLIQRDGGGTVVKECPVVMGSQMMIATVVMIS